MNIKWKFNEGDYVKCKDSCDEYCYTTPKAICVVIAKKSDGIIRVRISTPDPNFPNSKGYEYDVDACNFEHVNIQRYLMKEVDYS